MITKVIKNAQYMIEQYDDADNLVHQEVHPSSTAESVIVDIAAALEEANPDLKTIWFLVGEVSEEVYMAGTVVEYPIPPEARLFEVEGTSIPIASATRNGEQLSQHFYLPDSKVGDLIQFFDIDGNIIAELNL